jgi:hypothetical protein
LGLFGFIALGLFGVLLPAGVLVYELSTQACADLLFDPIPTPWHALLIALVPVANGLLLVRLRYGQPKNDAWLRAPIAFALAVELFYALIFAPMVPVSVLLILAFGLGLMPLSPLITLIITFYLQRRLRRTSGVTMWPRWWLALVLVLLSLSLAGMRDTLGLYGVRMAASAASEERAADRATGLRWLRRIGDDGLARICVADGPGYGYMGVGLDRVTNPLAILYSWLTEPVSSEQRLRIYYRASGQSCAAIPAKVRSRFFYGLGGHTIWISVPGRDGDWVAGQLPGLELQESRLVSRIRPETGTSYSEWTLVFRNEGYRNVEARAQLLLPPGGVVWRLTLVV